MAINFTITDTSWGGFTSAASNCSGVASSASSVFARECYDSVAAGSGASQIGLTSTATNWCVQYRCNVNSGVNWNAGNWTWRLNVTTSNMNITLASVYICHANASSATIATLGSATSLGVSLGSTGVKSGTISCSGASPSSGDSVVIVFVFSNGAMSTQTANITNDQNIDSPFTAQTRTPRPTSVGHPFIC